MLSRLFRVWRPILLFLNLVLAVHSTSSNSTCRCFPGDSCWPTIQQWQQFNETIGGKLIATIPIASACHNDGFSPYNETQCAQLQSVWGFPETHYESSSSIMAPFFANQSCDPFLPKEARCIIGTYIQYAVNASSAVDVQKTIAFVKGHNIRLVIRNTGHDYLGKSTGAGAVGIWTHHMKDIEFLDYRSPSYTGKAVKVGAGVQIFEVNEAAHAQSLVVVGGNCQTVGIAGGYSQGGGHGQLASKFGLAADQVLEWEVVTADGDLVTASPSENADLYWALAGGGGGTYGVVLSMTSKAYPELQTATANLTFTNTGVSQDTFLEAVQTFVTGLNPILDAGGVSIWLLTNSSFSTTPTTLPGGTKAELQNLLSPSLKALEKSNITYTYFIDEFSTYYESYQVMNPVANITEAQMGGRLIPRSLIDSNAEALTTAFQRILASETGVVLSGISVNVSRQDAPDNAVNPFWRESVLDLVIGTPWSYTDWDHDLSDRNLITNELLPILERLTPGGGGYLNEADSDQPHWQRVFYGSNYKALSAIKEKYDPDHIFYAVTGVGSEKWIQKADGRLCKL